MNSHISVRQPVASHRAPALSRPPLPRIAAGRFARRRHPLQPLRGQQPPRADDTGDEQAAAAPCCGNLVLTQDSSGNQVFLGYDLRGRKTQMQDPDMGTWTYAYDALGQLIRQIDAKGQTSLMTYDKLGRLTLRGEADLISHWYYDSYKGGGACAKGIGKLCQAETDHGYNKTISYDPLYGRYSSASTTIDTVYGDSVSYDGNGRLLTKAYPTGLTAKYVYTALGYLKEVRDNATNTLYWTANALDAEGHLLQQTTGNNVVTQQSYNAANGRITAITAGAGNGVQNLTYSYDNLGNILTRGDANQSLTESFGYDTLNRLQTAQVNAPASGIVTTTYAYNALGNMTSRTDLSPASGYTYPASGAGSVRPHAVSRVDFAANSPWPSQYRTYSYDANGNISGEAQYDASNQPVLGPGRVALFTSFNMPSVVYNDATSQVKLELSQYGPEHQRLLSSVTTPDGNRTTVYLNPDNSGGLFYEKETKASGVIEQRNYITAYGQAVAIVKLTGSTWSTIYLHRDNLGSTTAITDASGAVIERLAYEPFGNRRFANGVTDPNNTIVAVNTNRGFTNHEHFDELDLVHMNGRIYDPITGRFMSADFKIPDPYNLQAYNRYSYVINNPLLYTDPSGQVFLIDDFFIAVAIIGGARALGIIDTQMARTLVGISTMFVLGPQGAFGAYAGGGLGQAAIAGFAGGFVSSGNLQGGFQGAFTAGLFYGAGFVGGEGSFGRFAAHAAAGCVSSAASGGECGSGAMAAGLAQVSGGLTKGWSFEAQLVAKTVVGGTASVLGGGKFSNGALTAAFGHLFNDGFLEHKDNLSYPNRQPVVDPNTQQPYPLPPGFNMQSNLTVGKAFSFVPFSSVDFGLLFIQGSYFDYQRPDGLIATWTGTGNFEKQYINVTAYNVGAVSAAAGYSLSTVLWASGTYNRIQGNPSNSQTLWGLSSARSTNIVQGYKDYSNGLWKQ